MRFPESVEVQLGGTNAFGSRPQLLSKSANVMPALQVPVVSTMDESLDALHELRTNDASDTARIMDGRRLELR